MEGSKINIRHVFLLMYLSTPTTKSLNFEAAFKDGKFTLLEPGPTNILLTSSDPASSSKAFYLDGTSDSSSNYSLSITTMMSSAIEGFTGELSLVLLTLERKEPLSLVEVVVHRGNNNRTFRDQDIPDRPILPNSTHGILNKHIFKTWDNSPGRKSEGNRSIEMNFSNWFGSVYLIATSYSYGSSPSTPCPPSSWWGHSPWWDCGTGQQGPSHNMVEPLCVNYDLTCDDLPHCAQQNLPNSDEDCAIHIGLMEVLELIIYSLMAILLLLIGSALAKCFIRRRHIGRSPLSGGYTRRHNEIRELFAAAAVHRVQRPANAPPTYDDAMNFANDGFDQETIQEDPPEYNTPSEPREETSTPTSTMSSTTSLSSSTIPTSSVFPEPVDLIGEDDKVMDTGKEINTCEAPSTGLAINVVSLTCFENNFIDIPLGDLPKDPPAYSYLP